MIEYVSVEKMVDLHMRTESNVYALAWNEALDTALEKKNITRAVPEKAFKIVKGLLEGWKNEARYKKELAIADYDTATADIKRFEENAIEFALNVVRMLEEYGEESEEISCAEN
ncbi:MAG: hypothetical protein IKE85_06060 [Mogibacterium sp.]|nr:hypothetical protein [Mogibacterium sp.]